MPAYFELPDLRLPDLGTIASPEQMRRHLELHRKYLRELNRVHGVLVPGMTLLDLLELLTAPTMTQQSLRRACLQAIHHSLWWLSISGRSERSAPGVVSPAVRESLTDPRVKFLADELAGVAAEAGRVAGRSFGSGWLYVLGTPTEILFEVRPNEGDVAALQPGSGLLAVIDLWEHAYYCGGMPRARYVEQLVLEHLSVAGASMLAAMGAPQVLLRLPGTVATIRRHRYEHYAIDQIPGLDC